MAAADELMTYLELATVTGPGAPNPTERLEILKIARARWPDRSAAIDRYLIEQNVALRTGLDEAAAQCRMLRELHERLTAPPWHPAIFSEVVMTPRGPRMAVIHGNSRRLVTLGDGLDAAVLSKGDEVLLANQMNVILARSPHAAPPWGEIAVFQRRTPDGRLVLRQRGDEEVVVEAAATLDVEELRPDDLVRWHRECWMAFEILPRQEGSEFLPAEVPNVRRDQIGGQDANFEAMLAAVTANLVAPELAALYGLDGRRSILLVGPPGCGKTLLTRGLVSELNRMHGVQCRFAIVKPGEWEDPYVGVTQRRIRNCFEALNRAAETANVILFLDEIESVGRIRGGAIGHHDDKALNALLAELDGFRARSNVTIVAATNRKDLIDPALLQRVSEVELTVGAPDMRGAREIFGIHLPPSCVTDDDGRPDAALRREIIETAVARLYAPNGGNEVCVLRFRDGKSRTVVARDLASGRVFEQICRAARQAAFWRHARGEGRGVRVTDIETAVCDALRRMATTLTPANARSYLADLPEDVGIVSVQPVQRKVAQKHRYLNVA